MVEGIYGGVKTPRGLKSLPTSFAGSACDPSRDRVLSCARCGGLCAHPVAAAVWQVRLSSCRPACSVCSAVADPERRRRESPRRGQSEKRTVHNEAYGSPLLIG